MRADLERAIKDRESIVAAKQKIEEKLKEVTRVRDKLERVGHQQRKDLEIGRKKVDELMTRNIEVEDQLRQLKATIEQHPANIKIERNDAANMVYIHSFSNAIRSAHSSGLDLEQIWA